ncbi:heptaprenyl diphosphate synthase [Clostridium tetanomorphum]|uniref:Gx transporter family protein n=1 Tax=Clostridium tetanomorphum TaxID=1553 RepID=A0A923E7D9_CLOTT|nr:Gx transporter family protein [Clostridium tetanomorphum]KAJ52778.1 heptaprenyl diphosphate synthase component I [Clostridium tetanomorphum DSM 665]MBC2396471.1 Gx transporter family protein [Clostridium tetanomorphum]MBP1865361.1 heptaprenyl diphosphate synthase [Clostridium tetanomorphum]NRS84872.1 heptaprenyl diphosphate synthase [Clostridium tetanomorphum]NRZ98089.1 heptaprenyl diphosphate synthase [Clostridium tetanomorphum]
MKKTKKLVFLSLLVSIALIIYIVEAQLPVLVSGVPGIKLGLANSISLFALIMLGSKEALLIMLLRTTLGSFLGGTMSSFLYSIAGGLLSNLVMILLYKKFSHNLSLWSISVCGAIFHNIGQLLVAALVIQDFRIYLYLPVLMIASIITGYFIGVGTNYLYKHIEKVPLFKNLKTLD